MQREPLHVGSSLHERNREQMLERAKAFESAKSKALERAKAFDTAVGALRVESS